MQPTTISSCGKLMAGVKRAVQRGSCQGPLKAFGVSLRQVFLLQTAVALPLRAWENPNSHHVQRHQAFPRAQPRPAEQSSCQTGTSADRERPALPSSSWARPSWQIAQAAPAFRPASAIATSAVHAGGPFCEPYRDAADHAERRGAGPQELFESDACGRLGLSSSRCTAAARMLRGSRIGGSPHRRN
ncbi:hypothetical protein ACVIIW_005463 [Bradyrhizobium sp. USDA 4449]